MGLELIPSHKLAVVTIKDWWRNFTEFRISPSNSYNEPLLNLSSETPAHDSQRDIDVQAERDRVLSGSVDNAIIYLRNLRKVLTFFVAINSNLD